MIGISNYFYKVYPVKFIAWVPNFNDSNNKKSLVAKWIECEKFPPKLNNIDIIKRIGQSLGKLIGIESNFKTSSKAKFLIILEPDQTKIKS